MAQKNAERANSKRKEWFDLYPLPNQNNQMVNRFHPYQVIFVHFIWNNKWGFLKKNLNLSLVFSYTVFLKINIMTSKDFLTKNSLIKRTIASLRNVNKGIEVSKSLPILVIIFISIYTPYPIS